jgi:hypothetical protein
VRSGLVGQRLLEVGDQRGEAPGLIAQVHPAEGGDLVVARARGVQPPGGSSDQFAEPALDIHMDVLERALEIERALADL